MATKKNNTKSASATFLGDHEEKLFTSYEDLLAFLEERDRTDRWVHTPANQIKLVGLENASDLVRTMGRSVLSADLSTYEGSDEALADAMSENGLLIGYYDKDIDGWRSYAMRYTAWDGVAYTSGGGCRKTRDTESKNAVSAENRADWLTKCFASDGETDRLLLIRDGKVGHAATGQYVPIPSAMLLRATYENLPDESRFSSATVSHELSVADIEFGGEESDIKLQQKLESYGIKADDVYRVARFYTSDVGDSAAAIAPYIIIDGKEYCMGTVLKMPHRGKPSADRWREMLQKVSSLLKETVSVLERLAAIPIEHSAGCFRYCACELGLSKPVSLKKAEEFEKDFPTGCTALDVYRGMLSIVEEIEGKSGATTGTKVKNRENIARALNFNFALFDLDFEWK